MRAESIRSEGTRLVRVAPFRPFILSLENGVRVYVGHPENIAFDPQNGTFDFHVISGRVRVFGTFNAVSTFAVADSVVHLV